MENLCFDGIEDVITSRKTGTQNASRKHAFDDPHGEQFQITEDGTMQRKELFYEKECSGIAFISVVAFSDACTGR